MARRLHGRLRLVTVSSRAPRVLLVSPALANLELVILSTAFLLVAIRADLLLSMLTTTSYRARTPLRLLVSRVRRQTLVSPQREHATSVSLPTVFFTRKLLES